MEKAGILQVRPNPNMSTYDFLYKMVTALMIDNNALCLSGMGRPDTKGDLAGSCQPG